MVDDGSASRDSARRFCLGRCAVVGPRRPGRAGRSTVALVSRSFVTQRPGHRRSRLYQHVWEQTVYLKTFTQMLSVLLIESS